MPRPGTRRAAGPGPVRRYATPLVALRAIHHGAAATRATPSGAIAGHAADAIERVDRGTRVADAVEPEAVLFAGERKPRVHGLAGAVPEDPADTKLGVDIHDVVPVGERRRQPLHEHQTGDAVRRARV